ncbi:hypothetical protein CALCODRAFT_481311 [Calocera cornea HHB12733]|uniref:Uncharacterized protein n=1 Tax=Calocera cornea HHB12733 TaxID=1353952 RepID=A0A165HVT1_9BASI|nr:hypothetical protein CALCODRAFT_481311 [Calocera cornea HHB12733]
MTSNPRPTPVQRSTAPAPAPPTGQPLTAAPAPAPTPHPQPQPHALPAQQQPLPAPAAHHPQPQQQPQQQAMNSPVSPRRGAGAGRFTPSGVLDQAHESEWASRLGYAVFGKITSVPTPVLPGPGGVSVSPTPAHSMPTTPTAAEGPVPIPVAGGFRPTHRTRTSRSSLSGSPQTTGLFGPGDDVPDMPASPPPERVMREVVRPSPAPRSYPPPDTAQPESSDEDSGPPVHSPLSTPPATPSRAPVYRARQSSGGTSSASPGIMFPIENVQHTGTGYPVAPGSLGSSAASTARERDGHAHGHAHVGRDHPPVSGGGGAAGSRGRPSAHGRQ